MTSAAIAVGLPLQRRRGRAFVVLVAFVMALITLLEVVLAPLWVWIAVSEQPGVYTLLSGAIVIGAVVIQIRADSPRVTGTPERQPPAMTSTTRATSSSARPAAQAASRTSRAADVAGSATPWLRAS